MEFESVSEHYQIRDCHCQIRDCPFEKLTANITEKVKETISLSSHLLAFLECLLSLVYVLKFPFCCLQQAQRGNKKPEPL